MIDIETFSAINEDGLDKLVLDIYNSAEMVHKIFDNVNELIQQTSDFYQTNISEKFRMKYNDFKINFELVNKKLLGYADELASIKMKYQDLSFGVSQDIKTNMNNISNDFK